MSDEQSDAGVGQSVPTPTEAALSNTLEEVSRVGEVRCRLCNEHIDVSDADHFGDVFDALAEHGEAREDHIYDNIDGWELRGEDDAE